jgi:hypothetical protein
MSGEIACDAAETAHRVRLRLPDADLGQDCVLCGRPAAAALGIPEIERSGWELDVPVCAACLRAVNRPRRMAALCALAGASMVLPVLYALALWAAGVELKAGRPAVDVPFAILFVAPFAAAAWLAVRGRKLHGVHVVEFNPESGELTLHFADAEIARRVKQRNPAPAPPPAA